MVLPSIHLTSQSFTEQMNVTVSLVQMGKLRQRLEMCLLAQVITDGLGGPAQGCVSAPGAFPPALGTIWDISPSAFCGAV